MLEQLESFLGELAKRASNTTLEVGVCEVQTADEETRVLKEDS